jgi:hypothetical protein
MKAKLLRVGMTFNTGNYTSKRIDLEVSINAEDDIQNAARNIEGVLHILAFPDKGEELLDIIDNQDDYSGKAVREARKILDTCRELGVHIKL